MTSNNQEQGQTNDVWLLQDKLLTNDPMVQKDAIQELLRINSKESIFIVSRYLASKIYYGAPLSVITDIMGSYMFFAMDEVRRFRLGDDFFQISVNHENKITGELGLHLFPLPITPMPFSKVTKEDIYSAPKDIVDGASKGGIKGVKNFIREETNVTTSELLSMLERDEDFDQDSAVERLLSEFKNGNKEVVEIFSLIQQESVERLLKASGQVKKWLRNDDAIPMRKIIAIGRILDALGGIKLMRDVHNEYSAKSREQWWARGLDMMWSGIGSWQG